MTTLKQSLFAFLLLLTACRGGTPQLPPVIASATPLPAMATDLPPTSTNTPLVISINGQGLTASEFNAEITRYKTAMTALGQTSGPDEVLKNVRDAVISQFLLAAGASKAGFVLDANTIKQRKDALASKIGGMNQLAAWEKAHGYSDVEFEATLGREAAGAWMRDKIISAMPSNAEQVHVRQILLYNEDAAKSYYNQLQAGASFEDLAARVDPVTRGDIGWFPRGYLHEKAVEDAAFSLELGAYSPITPSDVGFHIIKLIEKQSTRVLAPDVLASLQKRALNDWLEAQKQKSKIELAP